jgi:hypothetical protein
MQSVAHFTTIVLHHMAVANGNCHTPLMTILETRAISLDDSIIPISTAVVRLYMHGILFKHPGTQLMMCQSSQIAGLRILRRRRRNEDRCT